MRRALPLLLGCLLLAACGQNGIFRDRGFDYLRAEPGRPLAWPEGLTPIPAQELYPVPDAEARARPVDGRKPDIQIPEPPQLVDAAALAGTAPAPRSQALPETGITLTTDGNGYPVLMLETGFDWAWQVIGDALKKNPAVKVDDLNREQGIYFLVIDGRRNSAGEPWQLKLNYTANGIQVALQVDENAMAPSELASPLMKQLRDGLAP